MNAWTRRLTMPLAFVLLTAGCAGAARRHRRRRSSSTTAQPSAARQRPAGSARRAAPPAATSPTVAEIARLEALVAADPTDADAQRDLGFALLQRVRETADPSLYAPAGDGLRDGPEAGARRRPGPGRDRRPPTRQAPVRRGAARPAAQAVALSPNLAAARAVVVDALVELGRYDEADAAAGEMLAIRADLSTLARVSYVAELHGKLDVALSAMRQAAATPGLAPENVAFVDALLGNLLVYTGDPDGRRGRLRAGPRARARRTPRRSPGRAGWRSVPATSTGRSRCSSVPRTSCRCPNTSSPWPMPRQRPAEPPRRPATSSSPAPRSSSSRPAGSSSTSSSPCSRPTTAIPPRRSSWRRRATRPRRPSAPPTPWPGRSTASAATTRRRLARTRRSGWARATRSCATTPARSRRPSATSTAARRDLGLALATDPGFSATGAAEARRILDSLPD